VLKQSVFHMLYIGMGRENFRKAGGKEIRRTTCPEGFALTNIFQTISIEELSLLMDST